MRSTAAKFHTVSLRIVLAMLLLAATVVQPAAAQVLSEVKIGALWHDTPGLWSGFQLERRSIDINGELLFSPSVAFLGGAIRPALGGNLSTSGQTSNAYAGLRWQYEAASGLFFGIGLGGTVHNGHLLPDALDRKALGARVLFHIPAEIGYRFDGHNSLSVYFEHMSNAYTNRYNEGFDRLGLRYGYKF